MGMAILSGFNDPVGQAQQTYRQVLEAMSHPGRVIRVEGPTDSPPPLSAAATACALTLLDFETSVWLAAEAQAAREFLIFHCHCPFSADGAKADFALLPAASGSPDLSLFNPGSHESPESSTTLIIEAASLSVGTRLRLSGPGVNGWSELLVDGLEGSFWRQMAANRERFPLGFDLILTCGDRLAALPRSTSIALSDQPGH